MGTFALVLLKSGSGHFFSQSRKARSAKAVGSRTNRAIKQIADQSDKQNG